ncbi:TonB-dependent receptor [Desulfovibrio sp. MES5]|uniref:TonB-dependent receptor plug domain-containing protein n=1 Tax=Desulfovibrio sp. MES5 TaxID=1899016 RepID=UPI0025BE3440|nr:TonB-dependent receptor [Desulfovibrio sp. MES5]
MILLRNLRRHALPLGLAGVLFWSAPAHAEPLQTDTVKVSASRVEKELLDVPMAVSVVTEEQIKLSPAATVGGILQDIPGVQVVNSGAQGLKRIAIRGESPNRVLILIDGQKIAENKSMDGSALLVDPAMIERIEVIKGPASVLYGSEAMGGVINIITKKGGTKPIQGQITTSYNGATRGFDESLSLFGGYEGLKYRVTGANTYQHNLSTPDGEAQHSKFKQQSGSAFLSYDFTPHLTVGGLYEQFYSEILAGDTSTPNFFVDMSPWERKKAAVFAEIKDIASFLPRLRMDAFWQHNRKKMLNHVESASGAISVLMDNYANNKNEQWGASLQSDWAIGENNYLITGYEFNRDGLDAKTDTDMTMNMSPMMKTLTNSHYKYKGYMDTHALYALMESKLPWDFTLSYGVRQTWVSSHMGTAEGWQRKKTSMSPNATIGPINAGSPGDTWESQPVFNVSLMWQGIQDLTLRAGFSQGFRVPNLQEKYVLSSMGGGTVYPNQDLKPERSNTWELGARYYAHGLSLDVTGFYTVADDYISSMQTGTNLYHYQNVSKAKTHGVEFSAGYDLPFGFTPYIDVTWMKREFNNDKYKTWKTGTPEWTGRTGVRALYPVNDNLDIIGDAYIRFASKTEQETGTVTRTIYSNDAWTTANAMLGVKFGSEKQYSVIGEVLNIFNEKYALDTGNAIYEPGVHANIKVSVEF